MFTSVIHNRHFSRFYLWDPGLLFPCNCNAYSDLYENYFILLASWTGVFIWLLYMSALRSFSSAPHFMVFLNGYCVRVSSSFFPSFFKKTLKPLNVTFWFAGSQLLLGNQTEMLPISTLLNFSLTFVSSLVLHRPLNPSRVVLSLPTFFFPLCNISNLELFPSTKWSLGSQYLNL